MEFAIKIFHVLISFVLIFVVLLQTGKGAEMGATFGGASSSKAMFGATGSNTFMTKLTTFAAVLFILSCLTLAYMSVNSPTSTLMKDVQAETMAPSAGEVVIPTAGDALPGTPEAAAQEHEGHNHAPGEGHGEAPASSAEPVDDGHNHPPGEGH